MAGLLDAKNQHDRYDHGHNNKNDRIAFHECLFASERLILKAPSENKPVQG